MCMHMSISSKEGDVHVHVHPIIFYACSAHVHCVKVVDQTCLKLLDKSSAVRSESAGGLKVRHLAGNQGIWVRVPVGTQTFPATKLLYRKLFINKYHCF